MTTYTRFFGNTARAAKVAAQKMAQTKQQAAPAKPALPPGATGWQPCSLTGFLVPSYMPVKEPKQEQNGSNNVNRP